MTTLKHLAEYNAFNRWFERNYPDLGSYCEHILPPVDETGVVLNLKYLDREMADMLSQIIYEYSHLLKKTG